MISLAGCIDQRGLTVAGMADDTTHGNLIIRHSTQSMDDSGKIKRDGNTRRIKRHAEVDRVNGASLGPQISDETSPSIQQSGRNGAPSWDHPVLWSDGR